MTWRFVRRWALLLVATALAAGPVVLAAPATADSDLFHCVSGQACVHITFPDDAGRAPVDVPPSVIGDNEDISDTSYPLRGQSGPVEPDTITGISVRALLGVLPNPVSAQSVQSTLARNPNNGYESPLHAGDLLQPPDGPFGSLEPAFGLIGTGDNTSIEYIRPQRSDTDVNYPDHFIAGSADRVIDLQVRTAGAQVHPIITVGKGPWHVNQPVPFTASFPDSDPPHAGATFSWTFAAGTQPATAAASTSHSYHGNNRAYKVSVSVSGDDPDIGEFYGQSGQVTVQVGTVKKSSNPGANGGGNGKGGKHHPNQGPVKGPGHHEGVSPKGGQTAGPTSIPSDAPTAGQATPGSVGTVPTVPPAGDRSTAPTATPEHSDQAGAFVRGVLLDGKPVAVSDVPTSRATRAAASARRPVRVNTSFDGRWLWLLAPVALLALGALGERRRTPHRHGPQSRV